ncbi:phosphate-starvation-inducible PsiE family protein [Agathobaculum sp.]|uniref:phosphate-starvation-inducible PsiE family protein n=1 Tax=Agathobaculum sp. TaxID=2048138 RepID=UPI002A8191C3|nr:phosphate-starvation-inducible PsiE family protein [Agathobaculum sp.]MDY3618240.1 phosphate-starvation-inducible PsiE family protein [Agathobaculum sp.]
MNSDLRDKLSSAATAIEIALGVIILFACLVSGIGMVCTTDFGSLFSEPDYLQHRLSDACFIIIGIELIKMITSYTIDSVVDVMLLAVARQMIVEHTAPLENLLAVLAVGMLFVIRKYLYISQIDRRKPRSKREMDEILRAQVFEDREAASKPDREHAMR